MGWYDEDNNEYWSYRQKKEDEYYYVRERKKANDAYWKKIDEDRSKGEWLGDSYGEYGGYYGTGLGSKLKTILCIALIVLTYMYVIKPINAKKEEEFSHYPENAIAEAMDIELNKEYEQKTYRNKLYISTKTTNRRWKGYSFNLTEPGTIDVEYNCQRKRKEDGPYWISWRLVDKNTGEVLEESVWTELEHDPFYLEKGDYVLEFVSISNSSNFDAKKRPFTFTVNFTPD